MPSADHGEQLGDMAEIRLSAGADDLMEGVEARVRQENARELRLQALADFAGAFSALAADRHGR